MPPSREHHREAVFVGGGDDFRVADRSAGLHDGGGAGGRDRIQAVAEREERVGRGDRFRQAPAQGPRCLELRAFINATLTASTRLI